MNKDYYEHYVFRGTHTEVGKQHGEALREKIQHHIKITYDLAQKVSGLSKDQVIASTMQFKPYIKKYAPGFLEEIEGMGKGANITMEEALLLQIRQEVVYLGMYGKTAPECTSFAVGKNYTLNGQVYSGQNADLAGDFEAVSNVITFEVTGKPKIMMLVPAGQISYLGINSEGMSVNCNFLSCDGWKAGYPRYLISRLLLEQESFEKANKIMMSIEERASSRNILLVDYKGNIANYEVNTKNIGKLEVSDLFVHSNHFLDPYMKQYEKSTELEMADSQWRLKRLQELMEESKGHIDLSKIKTILKDHKKDDVVGKFSVCMHECEETGYYHTFASIINDLSNASMEITKGLPCCNEYKRYEL